MVLPQPQDTTKSVMSSFSSGALTVSSPSPAVRPRHDAAMGVRFGVMGDSAIEVEQGLALLRDRGVEVVVRQPACRLTDGRWMALVAPQAPAGGEGLAVER